MVKQLPNYFPRTISQFVPSMEFAADVIDGVHIASLGAPAVPDPNGILAAASATNSAVVHTTWATTFDGSSTSLTTTNGKMDGNFGRGLTLVGTAGSDHVVTVRGRDYLGQPMRENFTLSGTVIQYGLKAFMYIDQVDVATGAASDTFDMGWSALLGLPLAAEHLLSLTEDDVTIPIKRRAQTNGQIWTTNSDASLFGSMATHNGFVVGQSYVATVANTTATSALTVEIGGTAVAGLSVTLPTDEAIGDAVSDFAGTNDNGLTSRIAAGGALESVSSVGGTAGIGHIAYYVDEGCLFVDADETAVSATTGDTRGTILPFTTMDASIVYEVRYTVNLAALHGLAQFNG